MRWITADASHLWDLDVPASDPVKNQISFKLSQITIWFKGNLSQCFYHCSGNAPYGDWHVSYLSVWGKMARKKTIWKMKTWGLCNCNSSFCTLELKINAYCGRGLELDNPWGPSNPSHSKILFEGSRITQVFHYIWQKGTSLLQQHPAPLPLNNLSQSNCCHLWLVGREETWRKIQNTTQHGCILKYTEAAVFSIAVENHCDLFLSTYLLITKLSKQWFPVCSLHFVIFCMVQQQKHKKKHHHQNAWGFCHPLK